MKDPIFDLETKILKDNNTNKYFYVKRVIKKSYFYNNQEALKQFQKMIHTDNVKQINDFYLFVNDILDVEYDEIINGDIV